jgi:hypothetical protein
MEVKIGLTIVTKNSQVMAMNPECTDKTPIARQWVSPFERQTYTVEEAAKILGISRAVAYRKGVLPTIRVAGRLLVPKWALERMLAETA